MSFGELAVGVEHALEGGEGRLEEELTKILVHVESFYPVSVEWDDADVHESTISWSKEGLQKFFDDRGIDFGFPLDFFKRYE